MYVARECTLFNAKEHPFYLIIFGLVSLNYNVVIDTFFLIIQGTILFVKSVEQNHNGLCSTTNWVWLFFFVF